jgi:hypothetical protein
MRGKTLLSGHALRFEGATVYDQDGEHLPSWRRDGSAKCECGALSPLGLSTNAAKKWHSMHKDEIRKAQKAADNAMRPDLRKKSSY